MDKIIIREEKEVKDFILLLDKINQIFKNSCSSNNLYLIYKGKIYSKRYNEDRSPGMVIANLNLPEKESHKQELFEKINAFINGKILYDYIKNYKKFINEVIIDEDKLIITNSNDENQFISDDLEIGKEKDFYPIRELIQDNKSCVNKKCLVYKKVFTEEEMKAINSFEAPTVLINDKFKLRVVKNMFLGYTAKKAEVTLYGFQKSKENYLYFDYIEVKVKNLCNIKTYFHSINY